MKRESERNTWELRDQTEELHSMLLMLKVILRGKNKEQKLVIRPAPGLNLSHHLYLLCHLSENTTKTKPFLIHHHMGQNMR